MTTPNLPPTSRRILAARRSGHVAHSRHLTGGLALLAGAIVLVVGGSGAVETFGVLQSRAFRLIASPTDSAMLPALLAEGLYAGIWLVAPVAGAVVLAAGMGAFLQVGPLFAWRRLLPDFRRLSPAAGAGGLVEPRRWARLAVLVMTLAAFSTLAYYQLPAFVRLTARAPRDLSSSVLTLVESMEEWAWLLVLVSVVVGVADYVVQWAIYRRELRMTRQELVQERRETDVKPEVAAERRRAMSQALSSLSPPGAKPDLIIAWECDAVGLRYCRSEAAAPQVVERGRGVAGRLIRAKAAKLAIPVVDDGLVTSALMVLEVGSFVPPSMFEAVASVYTRVPEVCTQFRE